MRLRPVHLLVLLIAFLLIKHRLVFAGRKYFLKKILKGAFLASLIRPNYVPIPIPVPMGHNSHLTGHLNTPHIPLSNLMHHHQAWPSSRNHYAHYAHHLPELPLNNLNHNHIWSGGWNDLQASMRSPIISQPPPASANQITSNLPFGLPMSTDTNGALLNSKSLFNNDYQSSSNLPSIDNLIFTPTDHLDSMQSMQLSESNPTYSFRKWFKKDLKKNLI